MHLATGPLVRLFTRNMYHETENRTSWYEPKIISKETKGKLEFWLKTLTFITVIRLNPEH